MMQMLVLFWGILFISCSCTPSATAAADVPTPTAWPIRFHALLVGSMTGQPYVMNLWYDWEKGGNMLVIQRRMVTPYTDMEWTNGTSFFWDTVLQTCRKVDIEVGILRPDWLRDADFLGVKEKNGVACNAFSKADFIVYYEDAVTGYPVYWQFHSGKPLSHILGMIRYSFCLVACLLCILSWVS